jgi:hypothetical protein
MGAALAIDPAELLKIINAERPPVWPSGPVWQKNFIQTPDCWTAWLKR